MVVGKQERVGLERLAAARGPHRQCEETRGENTRALRRRGALQGPHRAAAASATSHKPSLLSETYHE